MLSLALTLALAAISTNDFPNTKGVAVQGVQWDGGNYQAYGFMCGANMSCVPQNGNFGWVLLSSASDGGGGGSGAATTLSYITKVAEASLSNEFAMASLGSGLVINATTTGVPTIYAGASCTNQFPRAVSAAGSLTCQSVALASDVSGTLPVTSGGTGAAPGADDQVLVSDTSSAATWRSLPNCTDTGGNHLNYTAATNGWSCGTSQLHDVGTPPYAVQYNCAGGLCGADRVLIDGGNLVLVAMTGHPPAPGGAGHNILYGFLLATGMPVQQMHIDNAMGLPMPEGMMSMFTNIGTAANWRITGCLPQGFGGTAYTEVGDTSQGSCSTLGNLGQSWASTDLSTRSPVVLHSKSTAGTNTYIGNSYSGNPTLYMWRGINAGEGGFFHWTRTFITLNPNDGRTVSKTFYGIYSAVSLLSGSIQPSAYTNVCYFGNDTIGAIGYSTTTFEFCCNDGSGPATCTPLGANFPTTSGSWYDFYIWAPPAASSIYGLAIRLDSAQNSGLLTHSSNLPVNTVQHTFANYLGSGGQDAGPVSMLIGGTLTLWNY